VLTVTLSSAQVTVTSGSDATFTENIAVSPSATPGSMCGELSLVVASRDLAANHDGIRAVHQEGVSADIAICGELEVAGTLRRDVNGHVTAGRYVQLSVIERNGLPMERHSLTG
jgi:hypothetical protein